MTLSWGGGRAIYLLAHMVANILPTSNLKFTEEEKSSAYKVQADTLKTTLQILLKLCLLFFNLSNTHKKSGIFRSMYIGEKMSSNQDDQH